MYLYRWICFRSADMYTLQAMYYLMIQRAGSLAGVLTL